MRGSRASAVQPSGRVRDAVFGAELESWWDGLAVEARPLCSGGRVGRGLGEWPRGREAQA
ncbi:hypothetical protein DMP15_15130 [Pseudonocardia sp. UM4_GMWB1]